MEVALFSLMCYILICKKLRSNETMSSSCIWQTDCGAKNGWIYN